MRGLILTAGRTVRLKVSECFQGSDLVPGRDRILECDARIRASRQSRVKRLICLNRFFEVAESRLEAGARIVAGNSGRGSTLHESEKIREIVGGGGCDR